MIPSPGPSRAPSRPGGAWGLRPRRPGACSRFGRTTRSHGLGRGCTGRRKSGEIILARRVCAVRDERSPLSRYTLAAEARGRSKCAFSDWCWSAGLL